MKKRSKVIRNTKPVNVKSKIKNHKKSNKKGRTNMRGGAGSRQKNHPMLKKVMVRLKVKNQKN